MNFCPTRLLLSLLALLSCALLLPSPASAFKPEMHIQTANMAIYDALDGGICLDGLTGPLALGMAKPPQVMLGNTTLQRFVMSFDDAGTPSVKYHTWLLQYAPYIRAGAIGPDAYPDPITGQLFVHVNSSPATERPNGLSGPHELKVTEDQATAEDEGFLSTAFYFLRDKVVGALAFIKKNTPELETLLEQTPLAELFKITKGAKDAVNNLLLRPMQRISSTVMGVPPWRSVDWGHEVLWRAAHWKDTQANALSGPARDRWLAALRQEYGPHYERMIAEEQRAAQAFGLGYLMHMIGDGHIHTEITEIVGMPWSYWDTLGDEEDRFLALSWMSEEFRHMAMEKYLNDHYFPGSEPLERRERVDGSLCAPTVAPGDIVHACIPPEELILPPLACDVCNPLRGVDPRQVSARCDHCFPRCNPWKELCSAEIDLSMTDCGEAESCQELSSPDNEFGLNGQDIDQAYETCATLPDLKDAHACRSHVARVCNSAQVQCLCQKGVEALERVGILDAKGGDRSMTCLEPGAQGLREASRQVEEEARRLANSSDLLEDLFGLGEDRFPIFSDYRLAINERGCDPTPLDWKHVADRSGVAMTGGDTVSVTLENGDSVSLSLYGPGGYDLNRNGQPDLINQCILLNCMLSPGSCPVRGLDRDLDELRFTDILTCEEGFDAQSSIAGEQHIGLGRSARASCDLAEQSERSLQVNPAAVLAKDPRALEAFMNSTFIQTPKNFISQTMYTDRSYTDITGTDAPKPGEFGTYSLGGPLINGIYAMSDSLKLLSNIERAVLTDPLGLLLGNDPNNPVLKFLAQVSKVRQETVALLTSIANKIIALTPKITIKNPFTGRVIFEFDPAASLRQALVIAIQSVDLIFSLLSQPGPFNATPLGTMLERRIDLLEAHVQNNWIEPVSCAAEFIGTGAHRNYMVSQIRDFISETLDILIFGRVSCADPSAGFDRYCEAACRPPKLVKDVLAGRLDIRWYEGIMDDIFQTQSWISCQMDQFLHAQVFERLLKVPLTLMLEKTTEELLCTTLLGELSDQLREQTAGRDQLLTVCQQVNHILWHPAEGVNGAVSGTLLVALNNLNALGITIEDDQGRPINLATYLRDMRLLTTGTCWDGGLLINHASGRDMLRATFGDSAAIAATRTSPADPTTTQYGWLCPGNRFFDVPGPDPNQRLTPADLQQVEQNVPPRVKALEAKLFSPDSITDPYATTGDSVLMYNAKSERLERRSFFEKGNVPETYSPIRLLDSSHFLPVYNTILVNKLAFMGPGEARVICEPDLTSAFCQQDPKRCEQLAADCSYSPSAENADEDASIARQNGIRALIAHGNKSALGSGKFLQDPEVLYPSEDKQLLVDQTVKDADLELFFSSGYTLPPPDPAPYQRSCQDIGWNLLCDAIYSLDDPDDHSRQAHAWALDRQRDHITQQAGSGTVTRIPGFPDPGNPYYTTQFQRSGCAFRLYDNHPPGWLGDSLLPGRVPKSQAYFPRADIKSYNCDLRATPSNWEPLRQKKWKSENHSIGYTPHQRSFRIDTARPILGAQATANDPVGILHNVEMTRFSLANKGSHVARLYTKMFMPYHCPRQPDGADTDCDGVPDACDNCVHYYNPQQVSFPEAIGGIACEGERDRPNPSPSTCFGDPPRPDMGPPTQADMGTGADMGSGENPTRSADSSGSCQCTMTQSRTPDTAPLWLALILGGLWLRRRQWRA